MTAIDYIHDIDRADFCIEKCRNNIERLENLAQNLTSKSFENDRIQSSGGKDRIGDLATKIIMEKEKLARLIAENEEVREYVEKQIDRMDNINHSRIIYYRYIEKLRYEDIADIMDCSTKTVQNMHSNAIKEFKRVFVLPTEE